MKEKFKVGDKVRILDGSIIENYAGRWIGAGMKKYVGKVFTIRKAVPYSDDRIGYWMKEINFVWDERGLEPEKESKNETIVIYRKDREVIALDKRTGKKAVAKCSPKDKFDFELGARLAFERLFGNDEKFKVGDLVIGNEKADDMYTITRTGWRGEVVSVNGDTIIVAQRGGADWCSANLTVKSEAFDLDTGKYYNAKVVCVRPADFSHDFTAGKIYEVKDGKIVDDDGEGHPMPDSVVIRNIDDLKTYGDFIEVVQ